MKRLLIAFAAAVAVTTASAIISDSQVFEEDIAFETDDPEDDASALVDYESEEAKPSFDAPYPLTTSGFGSKFLELDTGDATRWRTNAVDGAVYFDMAMLFNVSKTAPVLSEDAKIAVFLNTNNFLTVLAGESTLDRTQKEYVTTNSLEAGTWGRLTVSSREADGGLVFQVRLNGQLLGTEDEVSEFPSLTASTTITHIGLKGSGAVDDFVARTTDPWLDGAVKIGGEEYASIQDALNDAGADAVIELLDNNADNVTLAANESLKLKKNGKNYTGKITLPDGYVVHMGSEDAQGVTTYSQVEGIVGVSENGTTWTWYETFVAGYTAAIRADNQPDVKIRVNSDFVPTIPDVTSKYPAFWTLTFISTNDAPIRISLSDGTKGMISSKRYVTFPSSATLVAISQEIKSFTGGTLEIPSGVTITATGATAFNNITNLTGEGTLVAPTSEISAFLGNSKYQGFFKSENWDGTLELSGSYGEFNPANYGNDGSTIRFNGFTVDRFGVNNATYSMDVEIVGNGLMYLGGDFTRTYNFNGDVRGSGDIAFGASQVRPLYIFMKGNTSEYTGNIYATNGNERVVFGGSTQAGGGSITVAANLSVTNDSAATWKANDIVLVGELVANGAISVSGYLWGNGGTGVYRANNANAAIIAANSWNGTYVVGWNPEGEAFAIGNCYGSTGAQSKFGTIQIDGQDGVFNACLVGNQTTTTNKASIVLNADTTLSSIGGTNFMFTGSVSGSGALTIPSTQTSDMYLNLAGDTSGFAGNITVSGSGARLVFGDSDSTPYAQSITVSANTVATNAASKTWTAARLEVNGELVANGTVTIADKLYGTGVYQAVSTAGITPDASWTGTYVINWSPSGAFNPNNYGNSESTVALANDLALNAYFGPGTVTSLTINPTVRLDADVAIKNGFSAVDDTYLVTFTKLTGDYNFTTSSGGGTDGGKPKVRYYAITTLDNFNGTLTVPSSSVLRIGTVNVTNGTDLTGCIVSADCQAGTPAGTIPGYPALTVEGVASGRLLYATVGEKSGLYRATVQSGDDYYLSIQAAVDASKTTVTLLANSSESFVLPAEGSMRIVAGGFTYSGEPTTAEGYKVVYDETTGTYTSVVVTYVAEIGNVKYETLKEAVDEATDGDVITLLDDIVLDTRVEPNLGANTTLAFNLGSHTLSRTGTSGNGSVIDVKSGSVVITNGVIDCTQDDTAIVADGVYALTVRSGASLTLDDLTVTVDSQAGACVYPFAGATVAILGGTYGNNTADAYQYHANWTGMAVNQANVAQQLITISGGRFFKVDPSLGDDSWADGAGTFLAVGKATTRDGDYWVVGDAQYTVRFFDDVEGSGQQIGESQTVTYGQTAVAPENNPSKAGYTFTSWSSDVSAAITADTDFYPVWAGKEFTIITYTNGVANASTNFTYAGETVAPADPVFNSETEAWDGKWYTSNGGSVEFTFNPAGATTQDAYATITAKSSPVEPAEGITPPAGKTAAEYASDINNAISAGKGEDFIIVPAAASGTKAQYLALLKAEVSTSYQGKVDIVFNTESAGYAAVTNALDTIAVPAVGADLSTIAAGAAASTTDVSITSGLTPGLYYSISYCTELGNFGTEYETEGARVQASATGAATLTTPLKTSTQQGFYRVNVHVSDK